MCGLTTNENRICGERVDALRSRVIVKKDIWNGFTGAIESRRRVSTGIFFHYLLGKSSKVCALLNVTPIYGTGLNESLVDLDNLRWSSPADLSPRLSHCLRLRRVA